MADLEITRLCAEAMGYRVYRVGSDGNFPDGVESKWRRDDGPESDLIGEYRGRLTHNNVGETRYEPLHDAEQNEQLELWLIKRAKISLDALFFDITTIRAKRRAICECVAKMQKDKHER